MNKLPAKSYIHYDLERVDYSVSKSELENIKNVGQNYWKDFSLPCLAIGISILGFSLLSEALRDALDPARKVDILLQR